MYARERRNVNDEYANYMHQHMEDHEGIILSGAERGVMQAWLASPWIKKTRMNPLLLLFCKFRYTIATIFCEVRY